MLQNYIATKGRVKTFADKTVIIYSGSGI